MGLFDKKKKKNNEETPVAPQATPEAVQMVQEQTVTDSTMSTEQGVVEQNPDNVFNASPGELTMPPVQESVPESPVQDIQIQNVAEPAPMDSPIALMSDTAATIDEPNAIEEQQTAMNVNSMTLFEDETKEDAITEMVSAAVNQEELNNQNIENESAIEVTEEAPVYTENQESIVQEEASQAESAPIIEDQVGTIGETIAGPTLENSIYEPTSESVEIQQEEVIPTQSEENVEIEDIISTEEAFIPDEIAESQQEVFELTSEPKVEEEPEPILELSDIAASDIIITSNVENENNTIAEEIIEPPISEDNTELEITTTVEEPVITEETPVIYEEPQAEFEDVTPVENTPIIEEENNEIIIDAIGSEGSNIAPIISEEDSEIVLDSTPTEEIYASEEQPLTEEIYASEEQPITDAISVESAFEVQEEQPQIEDSYEEVSPIIEEENNEISITDEETSPIIEEENNEISVVDEENSPIIEEENYEISIPEEETSPIFENEYNEISIVDEEISPIIETEISNLVLGDEESSESQFIEESEEVAESPVIDESSEEINVTEEEEDSKPIIEEKTLDLYLGEDIAEEKEITEDESTDDQPIIPIITEITDIEIPSPIEEVSEFMLDIAAESNQIDDENVKSEVTENINEEVVYNEEDVNEIYNNVTEEIPTEETPIIKEDNEGINLDSEEPREEEIQIDEAPEEEDEPVVLPFDVTFPHFETRKDNDEPQKVEVAENNAIYISEATNTNFCNSCGIILTDNSSICPSCGEPID